MTSKGGWAVYARLVTGCLLPLLLALVLQAFYTVSAERRTMTHALEDKARSLSTMMVNVTGPSLALDDLEELNVGLSYVKRDADLAFAAIVSPTGEILGVFGNAQRARDMLAAQAVTLDNVHDGVSTWRELVVATSPVHVRSKALGTVVIGLSTDNIEAAVRATLAPAVAITLAGIIVAAVVVSWLSGILFRRNRDLKVLMDNAEQGFLRVDAQGRLLPEHSVILERWFGPWKDNQSVWDYLSTACARDASWLQLMWENVTADVLPLDVALEQLPRGLSVTAAGAETQYFEVQYKPLRSVGNTYHVMFVISDVTAERAQEQAKAQQREQLAVFTAVLRDRTGVEAFFREARRLVESITAAGVDGMTMRRDLHTLKGNAATFGMVRLSSQCHAIEDHLDDGEQVLPQADREALLSCWEQAETTLKSLSPAEVRDQLEVDLLEQRHMLDLIAQRAPYEALERTVVSWSDRPARRVLGGFAHQAREVGRRLGKGAIITNVDADGLRVPKGVSEEFWSAFSHAVNNAIDHGIEPVEERLQAGKPAAGSIALRAKRIEGAFVLELEDDGRGINWGKLAERAKAAGRSQVDEQSLIQMILEGGISTKDGVSETSGRGVGLSALNAACQRSGGIFEVSSQPAKGTRLAFRWPAH